MNHKLCPACGEHPIINTETSRPPTASCNNIMCAWVGIGIHLDDWDAPRPLEDSLRAEVARLSNELEAYKARRCEYCLHYAKFNDGTFGCLFQVSTITTICCCGKWEPQPAPGGEEGKE